MNSAGGLPPAGGLPFCMDIFVYAWLDWTVLVQQTPGSNPSQMYFVISGLQCQRNTSFA
jgi:hypothetical protein